MLAIGIDGGGSHAAYSVVDNKGNTLSSAEIEQGLNPWKIGLEAARTNLQNLLKSVEEKYVENISSVVAGISGCSETDTLGQLLKKTLQELFPSAKYMRVTGDTVTGFAALSDQPYGQAALAGSGSSIVHFYNDNTSQVYNSVSFGGRDLGFLLYKIWREDILSVHAQLFLTEQFGAIAETATVADLYFHDSIVTIARRIGDLDTSSSEFKGLRPYINIAADRWAYKLFRSTEAFQQNQGDEIFDTVFVGGLWSLTYLRERVFSELTRIYPNIKICFDQDVTPLDGAVKLAMKEIA
jgi:hypothetical protein